MTAVLIKSEIASAAMLSRVWTLRHTYHLTRAHTSMTGNMLVAQSGRKTLYVSSLPGVYREEVRQSQLPIIQVRNSWPLISCWSVYAWGMLSQQDLIPSQEMSLCTQVAITCNSTEKAPYWQQINEIQQGEEIHGRAVYTVNARGLALQVSLLKQAPVDM